MNVELLKELGLDEAANKLDKSIKLKQKLMIAYEKFKIVSPETFDKFNQRLKEKTYIQTFKNQYQYEETFDQLLFIPLSKYTEIPPPDCLMDLKKAKELNIFDSFEVCKTQTIKTFTDNTPRPDPIIFGVINGCVDKFFITQWDDDISIEQIIEE